MKKPVKYSPEVRERAARLVTECRKDHPSQWAAIESIAAKIGCSAATLRVGSGLLGDGHEGAVVRVRPSVQAAGAGR